MKRRNKTAAITSKLAPSAAGSHGNAGGAKGADASLPAKSVRDKNGPTQHGGRTASRGKSAAIV
ncbi:MAG: hypothetical protein WCL32_22205, partial [Planctomycetota bacterium]